MSADDRITLDASPRKDRGSRNARRLRRGGAVPGVLYGPEREPVTFSVGERELRAALKQGHALMDISLEGSTVPVIVKDQQHHPVRGGFTHLDLLEVDLKVKIHAAVPIELTGVETAPGVVEGGVLDHVTRELNIEALPTDIPDVIHIDVGQLEINSSLTLADAVVTESIEILDDPHETVIATITPPSKVEAPEAVEEETEVVGEEGAAEEAAEEEGSDESESS